jgi:ubiquinone/menaquinone biosynthesis C-methylase UbiE
MAYSRSPHRASDSAFLAWDSLLGVQTDLFLPHELAFLLACPQWSVAQSVLDVGCGNGDYLGRISSFFPKIRCTGIDISSEMVSVARATHGTGGIDFSSSDFFQYEPPALVDVILMRLVLQHLQGIEPVLSRCASMLRPDGGLYIFEPDPSQFRTLPETPLLTKLLGKIEESALRAQTNRARLSELPSILNAVPGWKIDRAYRTIAPSISSRSRQQFLHMCLLWIDIVEASKPFDFPFDETRVELEGWAAKEASYGQVGLSLFALRREADPESF